MSSSVAKERDSERGYSTKPLSASYGTFDVSPAAGTMCPNETILPRRASFWKSKTFIILCVLSLFGLLWFLKLIRDVFGLIWYVVVCGSTLSPRGAPKTWTDYNNQTFAIGFDLTAGYGTAVVMLENGTIVDVGRAEGNDEYNEVLARLSLQDSVHPSPAYYDCPAQTSDLKRQWRRYFRRRLGRPAFSDVATLATVFSDLKLQTNAFLQSSGLGELEIAFITAPDLPALYAEDLADATEFAKVQMLTLPGAMFKSPGSDGAWVVSEINTACAGNGLGLSHLHDGLYTKDLSSEIYQIDDNRRYFDESQRISYEEIENRRVPWPWNTSALSVLFTKTAFSYGLPYEVSRAIIYGESAHDEDLNAIIREEIQRVRDGDEVERQSTIFYSEDPVYAAARGAAILAGWCPKLKDYYSCFPDLRPRMRNWF